MKGDLLNMKYGLKTILVDSLVERNGFHEVTFNWNGKQLLRRINFGRYGLEYIVVEGKRFEIELKTGE
jgi:hypothetical protein